MNQQENHINGDDLSQEKVKNYGKIKLFIGGIPTLIPREELVEILNKLAPIRSLTICKDKNSGISRGYAFFGLEREQDAHIFLEAEIIIQGRKLHCQKKESSKTMRKKRSTLHWRLFLSRLPQNALDNELVEPFRGMPGFLAAYCIKDIHGNSKRYGFADFQNEQTLKSAFRAASNIRIRNVLIKVSIFERRGGNEADDSAQNHNSTLIQQEGYQQLALNSNLSPSPQNEVQHPLQPSSKKSKIGLSALQKIAKKSLECIARRPLAAYRFNTA